MRKIHLDPETLAVETFDPTPATRAGRGTVHGHASAYWEICDPATTTVDPRVDTCGCTNQTCDATCDDPTCYNCGGGPTAGCPVLSVDPQACIQPPRGPSGP